MKTPEKNNEGLLILRQCCDCKKWLDETSKMVAESRPAIEYVISHGLCEDCFKKIEIELEDMDEEDDLAPPDLSDVPDDDRVEELAIHRRYYNTED